MTQQFHSWVFIKNKNTNMKRDMHPDIQSSIIYNSQEVEET